MKKRNLAIIGVGGLLLAGSATGVAVASGNDDGDGTPITGPELEQASAAALASTGGGRVTETEVDDEEGKYEVEVTLDNGDQVDVHLDSNFNVTSSKNEGKEDPSDDNNDSGDDD